VASMFFLGSIVKNGVETVGPRVTLVEVKLDSADVWLLPGRAQLNGLSIGNPPGYKARVAIKVDDINVRLNTMSALSDKVIIDSVTVNSPEITIEGGLKKNNLTQIQKNVNDYVGSHAASSQTETKPAASPSAVGKPGRKFQINELVITGARLHIAGLFATGASVTIPLPDIHLVNLGAGQAGITSPEVAQKVLTALLGSIATNAADAIGKLGKDAVKELDFKKAGEKLKGLLGQ
jgi:hypothetical protein